MSGGAFLLVRAAGRLVGLPVEQLDGLVELDAVDAIPLAEPALRGVAVLRGADLPVLHLGALLAGVAAPESRSDTAVVTRGATGRLGLEIEAAELVIRGELVSHEDDPTPWTAGFVRHGAGLIPVLDLRALAAHLVAAGRV